MGLKLQMDVCFNWLGCQVNGGGHFQPQLHSCSATTSYMLIIRLVYCIQFIDHIVAG